MRPCDRRSSHVSARHAERLVVEELGLFHGASRVDLAVVGRSLHGYEIKSDRDSLDRLEQQAADYRLQPGECPTTEALRALSSQRVASRLPR